MQVLLLGFDKMISNPVQIAIAFIILGALCLWLCSVLHQIDTTDSIPILDKQPTCTTCGKRKTVFHWMRCN
jgi:hypothetical protein